MSEVGVEHYEGRPSVDDAGLPVDTLNGVRPYRPFVVFAFDSARESMRAETVLKESGFGVRVMPLPRHRVKLCGIALRLPPEDERAATDVLAGHGISISARDMIEDV